MNNKDKAQNEVVCKSNHLIQKSKINLTVNESRIINYLISKIKPTDTEIKPIRLDYKEFCKIAVLKKDYDFSYIKKIVQDLYGKHIFVLEGGYYVPLSWLGDFKINRAEVILTLHHRMGKYLLQLVHSGGYTQSQLETYFLFKCKHSFVLYDLLKSHIWKNKGSLSPLQIEYTIDELKEKLEIAKESYKVFKDFRRNVLDKVVAELNNTDLIVEYEPIRTGRSYTHIKFKIKKNQSIAEYRKDLYEITHKK